MKRLKYEGTKKFTITMTKTPISNPQASPSPTGVFIDKLDPSDPKYLLNKDEILRHANYSESEDVTLKPGINEFENDEQAEYFYKILGNPEEGGTIRVGVNSEVRITNRNILIEVDAKGEEVKGAGSFWEKYRKAKVLQLTGTR